MKGFEKGMPPSKSNANRNLPFSGFVENNENDSSVDKLIPQFENHKITHRKNFISVAPRKKILAEINEDPSASDAQGHKNSNLETGKSGKKKGVSDSAFEPKDDSSVKVYDPLTNYLSPRPQYLRFNPNRRREILKRLEKESSSSLDSEEASDEGEWSAEEIVDSFYLSPPPKGSAVNQRNGGIFEEVYEVEVEMEEVIEEFGVSSLSPPKGSSINQRDGEIFGEDNGNVVDGDEAEEEEEGETEERGWCLRGILKLLLTLIACLLSTSYICSMNSPSDSQTEQVIWNSKDSLVIKNETLEFVSMQLQDHGFIEVEYGGGNRIEEVEVDKENYYEFDGSTEEEIVENLERKEKEIVDEPAEFVSTQLQDHGFFEVEDGSNNSVEEVEVDKESYEEFDESIEEEIIEYLEWKEKEMTGGNYIIDEVEVDKENYDEFDGSIEAEIVEYLEWKENEDSEDLVDEAAEAAQVELKTDEFEHSIDAETDENLDGGIVKDTEVVSTYMTLDEDDNANDDEAAETEIIGSGVVDSEELVGSQEESSDSIYEVDELGDDSEKSEWNTSTVVGFSAVVMISTSLAIIYHSKKSRRNTSSEESEPLLKQTLAVEENVNSVLPSIDRKVEFLARAPLSSHSMREAPRELPSHINPPTVELIGEIVLGQPSSSHRNSGKFQMALSEEECNATLSQKRGSLPRPVPAPSQPSVIEHHPSASLSSCGSLTTVIKMSKKQGGRSREAMTETTSVRRSNRLRNRAAVMSP